MSARKRAPAGLPRSISAMVTRGASGLCPFEQAASLGTGSLERRDCALRNSRIVQISALLALVLGQQEQAVFQRLREWYLDAHQKSGKRRREVDVTTCFAPLLKWIVRLWAQETRQMVLVLEATTLGERWIIQLIASSGCGSPSL